MVLERIFPAQEDRHKIGQAAGDPAALMLVLTKVAFSFPGFPVLG